MTSSTEMLKRYQILPSNSLGKFEGGYHLGAKLYISLSVLGALENTLKRLRAGT